MDLAELIALIHQESIADFIPLREIPDEETRREYQERLQEQFYQFPYHYKSFQEAYPNTIVADNAAPPGICKKRFEKRWTSLFPKAKVST